MEVDLALLGGLFRGAQDIAPAKRTRLFGIDNGDLGKAGGMKFVPARRLRGFRHVLQADGALVFDMWFLGLGCAAVFGRTFGHSWIQKFWIGCLFRFRDSPWIAKKVFCPPLINLTS
jgi:hypothetical protein